MDLGNASRRLKFKEYEVDARAGELYRLGKKVKLQQQPMQVLVAMLEAPGGVVTREELRQRIWPADTFVDFEHSLNTAIKKLRQALGDRATNSKFVETLPRRGYRFLPAVAVVEAPPSAKDVESGGLEGIVLSVVAPEGTECVAAPLDAKAFGEWKRLTRLNDDVGVAMMITDTRLLLLAAGLQVRMLSVDASTGWCEVRILEGEHYGKTALVEKKSLRAARPGKQKS